jgi:hypothetical protein
VIWVGLDDTDVLDHPGTNQLARHIAAALDGEMECVRIVRHQLLFDPRIPYTSKNGSASMWLEPRANLSVELLIDRLRSLVFNWCPAGSDPGLCVATQVPNVVTEFGRRCQREIVTLDEALALAARCDVHLEGLGGTHGGAIGALAAVGLTVENQTGRIVHLSRVQRDLYDVTGRYAVNQLSGYGIDYVFDRLGNRRVESGQVDVGKRLRPNVHDGQVVLFVEPASESWASEPCWAAVKVV